MLQGNPNLHPDWAASGHHDYTFDPLGTIARAIRSGNNARANRTIELAYQFRAAGLPGLHAREAAETLVQNDDLDHAHALLLRKLQDWGYVSRQAL